MSRTENSWAYLDVPLEKNYLWSLAVTILPLVGSFAVAWIIARWAGPQVIGTVSWTMAFATTVLIFGKFGMGLASSRLASEYGVKAPERLRALLKTGIFCRAVTTTIVALLVFTLAEKVALVFNDPTLERPIRTASFVVVCASLYEFMEHFLVGLNRIHTVYKVRYVNLILRVVLTALLVLGGWGAVEILSGYCGAWFGAIAIYLVLLLKYLPSSGRTEDRGEIIKRLFILGVPLAVSSASVTIFSQMDRLMIGYFFDMEEVGQYSVARNVSEVSLFPAFAMVMTLRPALASRFSTDRIEECAKILQQTLLIATVFGVLFASIFAVFAVPLLTFVFSREFLYAGELMAVFIWVILLRSIGSVILPALVAAERTKFYAYLTAFSAAVNFALNLMLIPLYRSKGAVIATIISYSFLLILGLYQISEIFRVRFGAREVSLAMRTVLAGVLAGGLFWLIVQEIGKARAGTSDYLAFICLILQTLIYAGLLFLFRVVKIHQVLETISKVRKSNSGKG